MKSIAALAFFAAAVAAQSPDELRGQLPECALSCIEQAAEEAGCESGDFACECENQEAITASATACQLALGEDEMCSGSDLQEAMDVGAQICEAVESGDDASATESGDDASATDEEDEPTETGEEDPEESGDDSADDSGDDNSGDDSEGGDSDGQDSEGEEDGAAMRLNGYGWAGAAAAAVALVF